jgi:hypothetical protein
MEMAERVSEFLKANPFPEGEVPPVMATFEERLATAKVLAGEQHTGLLLARNTTVERKDLRRDVTELLRQLTAVAGLAAGEDPSLKGLFDPKRPPTYLSFITAAKEAVAAAEQRRELLRRYGMTDKLFGELTGRLAKLEAVAEAHRGARRTHVSARLDLETVTADLVRHVEVLHGINRWRFPGDDKRWGTWLTVRSVFGPDRVRHEAGEPPADPEHGGEGPTTGSLPTAA